VTRILFRAAVFATLATGLLPAQAAAQGGPPLITDDPDTPGPRYWEINIGTLLDKTPGQRRLETPRIDLNYGIGRSIQLKFEMPLLVTSRGQQENDTGPGSATAGVKWRFIGQEGRRIAWSIYPQLTFDTTSSREFLMPTELTVEIFHLEINGEVGRNFVAHGPDEWIYGVSTEGHVLPRLELLAELHAERVNEESEVMAVGGGRLKLTSRMILLLAAGHTVHSVPEEGPRLYFYAGLQLNLPGQFRFDRASTFAPSLSRPRASN
jgi:hypothetical protein